jgi:hypothetical protein
MKNILSSLNESEKRRILEMHYKASNRQYLNEQDPNAQSETTSFPTSGVEKDANFPVDKEMISRLGVNTSELTPKVQVSFNHDTGASTVMLIGTPRTGPSTTWKSTFGCKCPTAYTSGPDISPTQMVEKTSGFGGTKEYLKDAIVTGPTAEKWIKERCVAYLKDKNCAPVLATRDELNALYQRATPTDIQTSDRKTICKFVKTKQGFIGMEGHTDKQKIMDKFLSNFAFYAEGTDRKVFDNISSQDFTDKGELFCKGWGL